MKKLFCIRLLIAIVLLFFCNINLIAQSFPTFWGDASYDTQHGTNGFIRLINSNSESTGFLNKIYSVCTNIDNVKHDLFRVTSQGISTFSSPNGDFDVKIDLYRGGTWQGCVRGSSDTRLILQGANGVSVFNNRNERVVDFNPDNVLMYKKLNVQNPISSKYNNIEVFMGVDDLKTSGWIGTQSDTGLHFGAGARSCMYIHPDRNVYVGLGASEVERIRQPLKDKYNLFVWKGVLSNDYGYAPTSSWSDFVFETNYQLRKIEELESFIICNKHLPDVPSAQQVAEEGYSQHDMNKVLLQKIEELTLYVIQQQKEINTLKMQGNNK